MVDPMPTVDPMETMTNPVRALHLSPYITYVTIICRFQAFAVGLL